MQNNKVIAIVGMPGAGKSFCVDHLKSLGYPSVYFGGVIIDEVTKRGLEVNEVNEKSVREELRAIEGMGFVATRMIGILKEQLIIHDIVVADGLYSWSEYKILKEVFRDNIVVIAVTAPRNIRHQRLKNRPVRPLSEAEVSAREYAEIENIEKGGPIANADYTLVNDDTSEQMLTKLDQLIALQ